MTNLPRIRGLVAYGTPAEAAQYFDLNFASVGVSTEAGTAYTFRPTDSGGWVRFTSSSAVTATIAPFSSIELPFGAVIMVEQAGAAPVTVAAGAGVTIYGLATTTAQYAVLRLVNVARDVWNITGEGAGEAAGSTINVLDYGAVGDGVTDDTEAVRNAFAAFAGQTIDTNVITVGKLVFPPGVYLITDSINCQDLGRLGVGGTWTVDMWGAVIHFKADGKTLFDCAGARWGTFNGGLMIGDLTDAPAIGIQLGRLSAVTNSGDMLFNRNSFIGKWTRGAWYLLGAEDNAWYFPYVRNLDSSGVCILIDGVNHFGLITEFTDTTCPTDTPNSTSHNGFFHPDLRIPTSTGSTSPGLDVWYGNNIAIYNGYIAVPGPAIRHTSVGSLPSDSVIEGLYYDLQCEINTASVEFRHVGTSGTFVVDNLYLAGYSQATDAVIVAGSTVTVLYLHNLQMQTNPYFAGALFNIDGTLEIGGHVNGNQVSQYLLGANDFTFSTTNGNLGQRGAINRAVITSTPSAAFTYTLPSAAAVPPGWTFTIEDGHGGLTDIKHMSVARGGVDTINGSAASWVFGAAYSNFTASSDGATAWTVLASGSATYTAYTPTITSGTGTITASSVTARFRQSGKTVFIEMVITITTNGSGATYVNATLPDLGNAAANYVLPGDKGGQTLAGFVQSGIATVRIRSYDGTYPGADGAVLYISGSYEVV